MQFPPDVERWRAEDAGKLVKVNGGLIKLDTITSSTVAQPWYLHQQPLSHHYVPIRTM